MRFVQVTTDTETAGLELTINTELGPWPQLMDNPIRQYDWGSSTALARLQGRAPSDGPEAELWMGAHPSAPSRLVDGEHPAHAGVRLDDLVSRRPADLLGATVHDRFGARLPFMLKILAISRPLSVQVHPTADRARTAYEGEVEVAGEHSYTDPFPKPELLYALEPIDALCGFRTAAQARALLELVGGDRMLDLARTLDDVAPAGEGPGPGPGPGGASGQARGPAPDEREIARLEAVFERLVTWPAADRTNLVAEVADAARALLRRAAPSSGSDQRRTLTWVSRLAAYYPGDPLVAAPFILDLVHLEPGETLFVPAGAPHCYLYGLGVEILGNSDNVLRAGLTHKAIAVEELLRIVHGGTRPQRDIPETWVSPHEVIWTPGVPEFRLSRVWLHDRTPITAYPHIAGPQIVLCTAGEVRVACGHHEVHLTSGRSAFIGATAGPITLAGAGEVFRAFAGEPD